MSTRSWVWIPLGSTFYIELKNLSSIWIPYIYIYIYIYLHIYHADVSNNKDNETKFCYGLTETSLKERYGNHKRSFKHERYKNDTELSKYIWDLTSSDKVLTIKWSIVRKIHGNKKPDFCKLYLTEKYFIWNAPGTTN